MPKPRRSRPQPSEVMRGLLSGYWVSQTLFTVAELGVADALAERPLSPDALAKKVGAHAPSLRRVLRSLASLGVFAEDAKGRFRLTPLARTLRRGPGTLRDYALMIVDDFNWQAFGALHHAVTTGANAFEHVHGVTNFEYLRERPEKERRFAAAMASNSAVSNEAVARAYPYARLRTLVDVGGAHGHLLAAILRRHAKLRGVLYDQPQVVAAAAESGYLAAPGIRERCEVAGGNFFETVPDGADGYLMKHVLHDWDDERCVRILALCREAMARDGRVLVVEHVVAPGNAPSWAKHLDLMMMVGPGGLERTRVEFRALFAEAGLRLARVHPTAAGLSVLEAVQA